VRGYSNPFRSRASEQQRDLSTFVRTFAVGALDVMPESIWDRLVVVRSAPGGGKTSLMRVFTAPSLDLIHTRRDELEALHGRLQAVGAISRQGPTVLGVLLNLARDYQALLDLGAPPDVSTRLFFRLLDARIMTAVVRASLSTRGLRYPQDADRLTLKVPPGNEVFLERLGGASGAEIVKHTLATERRTLDLLDSLLPVAWEDAAGSQSELYSLRALSECTIEVGGVTLRRRPLIMLDDGHALAPVQRDALLDALADRRLAVARWYAERLQAMDPEEVLGGEIEGRDLHVVAVEETQRLRRSYRRVLIEAGNLRAGRALERYADERLDFFELLEVEEGELLGSEPVKVAEAVRDAAYEAAGSSLRLRGWLDETPDGAGYADVVLWRQKQIVIEREKGRRQMDFFALADEADESEAERLDAQLTRVAEAARLFLAREHRLPYYAGAERIAALASWNVEQFLSLCGDLFEAMLGSITLRERPRVSAARQDALVRRASERLWRQVLSRVPNGRELLRLLESVAALSRAETERPSAPYAPGVTGIAITMEERRRLLEPAKRAKITGGDDLLRALAAGSAFNLLSIELNQTVKHQRVAVIYLNRLLCPRLNLPLQRGGFRERQLEEIAGWAAGSSAFTARAQVELA
jgi:hypothetical protein